jgi:MFS family permease
VGTSTKAVSTWAPLRIGFFRALWIAVLVSNIGTWMQTVGAQWLLVNQPHASILVALVQTADMLPDVLLAYVGGVIADTFDRRWILIVTQACQVITGLVLTILASVQSCRATPCCLSPALSMRRRLSCLSWYRMSW